MPVLPRLTSFIRTLSHGSRLDAELDDELRAYLDLLTEEKVAAGLTPEAARRAALVESGRRRAGEGARARRARRGGGSTRSGRTCDTRCADFAGAPWFTATGGGVARHRHRLQHRDLQCPRRGALSAAPVAKDPERIVEITMGDFSNEWSGVTGGQFDEWEHGATLF